MIYKIGECMNKCYILFIPLLLLANSLLGMEEKGPLELGRTTSSVFPQKNIPDPIETGPLAQPPSGCLKNLICCGNGQECTQQRLSDFFYGLTTGLCSGCVGGGLIGTVIAIVQAANKKNQ